MLGNIRVSDFRVGDFVSMHEQEQTLFKRSVAGFAGFRSFDKVRKFKG